MEAKWPFFLILFTLLFLYGYTVASMERSVIMNHWPDRRCDMTVIAAAGLFKPEKDPRSSAGFAAENLEFCTKTYVDKFIAILMGPVNTIFGKHVGIAGGALDALSGIRNIAHTLYNTFSSYLDRYFRQFHSSIFQISRIVQYLRMAVNRIAGIAMSMIYTGITLFRGMLNTIQFAIKVILIICGILIALIILLWFVLFPVIPIVISTLTAVVTVVLSLAMVMSASIAGDAESKKGGFCFASETHLWTSTGPIPVTNIRVGDSLRDMTGKDYGTVTHIIQMVGDCIPLYDLHGIQVSGSHLVEGTDGQWKSVASDKRAVPSSHRSAVLYCFNTTSNQIPVRTRGGQMILFRDWEEIANEDEKGQMIWNYFVLSILNGNTPCNTWKEDMTQTCEVHLFPLDTLIETPAGYVAAQSISLGDSIVDGKGGYQTVLGIIEGQWEGGTGYEWVNGMWRKGLSVECASVDKRGITWITSTGEIIVGKKRMRDFTEVGYDRLSVTYPFVEARLRFY